MPDISLNEGLYRFGGQYGYVVIDSHVRAEVVEITGTIEVGRIEVPLVNQTRLGFKPGRETREGTFRIQKIDTFWEQEVFAFLNQNLQERRAARGTAAGAQRPFDLQIWLDDPDALGAEVWQLSGCLLWRLPLGFSITDDLLDREFPFTWEKEEPLKAFHINHPQTKNPETGQPTITVDVNTDLVNPTP